MKALPLLLLCGCSLSAFAQRPDNYCPPNSKVSFTQSTLPIVKISVNGSEIQRRNAISARLTIINNGDGAANYVDGSNQTTVYDGDATIKYVGNSTFTNSEKKTYLLQANGKNWLLKAEGADRSMVRTLLASELAANFMSKVPTAELCEVTIDGVYYGIFNLSTPNESLLSDGETLVSVDRNDAAKCYTSAYKPYTSGGSAVSAATVVYHYVSPDASDAVSIATTNSALSAMEQALRESDNSKIALTSFADYLLNSEFAHNADAYRLHADMWISANGVASMIPGDATLGFGNYDAFEGFRSDSWVYNTNDIFSAQDEPQLIPFYWYTLTHNADFQTLLKSRWAEYRKSVFSNDNVTKLIDGYISTLKMSGAAARNEEAWSVWERKLWPNYYRSTSLDDEATYLKQWIADRLQWMDNYIGEEDVVVPEVPTQVVPVKIASGFNEDCIAESSLDVPLSVSAHPALDGHGSILVSAEMSGVSKGIPANGNLVVDNGNTYQFANFTADNCLYLKQTSSAGTLTFAEQVTADSLCVLLVGTNRDMYELSYVPTVTYSDGTTEQIDAQYVSDWCVESYGDFVYKNLNRYRTDYNGGGIDGTKVNLSENKFKVSSTKPIKSVTFTSQCRNDSYGYGMVGIFAISAVQRQSSGIESVGAQPAAKVIKSISSVTGVLRTSLQKGINIVVYTDGTSAKIYVK
jgi:hypothetical protein